MKRTQGNEDLVREFRATLVVAVVLFLGFVVGKAYVKWLKSGPTFQVRRIEIEGNDLLSDARIEDMARLRTRVPIWQIDLVGGERSIETVDFVDDVVIRRRLPDVIQIEVHEKKPVALIRHKQKLYCVDGEGLIIPSEPGKMYDLPILSGPFKGEIHMGQKLGGHWIPQALDILQHIRYDRPAMYSEISEMVLGDKNGILIYTCKYGVPVYVGDSMSVWKIRCFDSIYRELMRTNELKLTKYIDLRYRGQIFVGRSV
ncbi:FtsQ-type POTRA domain-containing protein [bacterium]|nr:FtsQ-type POTRA domain-containing protein [bacterium]